MNRVVIYSDGACEDNPGPGGWGAVLFYGGQSREISGGVERTTNNRMELQAAIEALKSITETSEIDFYTDSKYLQNGITSWITNWKRNGWRTSKKGAVKNAALWQELDRLVLQHQIGWHWAEGHAGNPGNERAHRLASSGMRKHLGREKAVDIPAVNTNPIEIPANSGNHGLVSARITTVLSTHVAENDLGYVFASGTGFLMGGLPGGVIAPDVAFVSKAKLADGKSLGGFVPTAPDLAVKMISSSESREHLEEQAAQWIANGVAFSWIVNTDSCSITVWQMPDQVALKVGDEILDAESILPGFKIAVSDLLRR